MMMPWCIFLFVGALDWGFFSHALISTASAARVTALYASTSASNAVNNTTNTNAICTLALAELRFADNDLNSLSTCTALPVVVSYSSVSSGADGQAAASVTVQYQTVRLIPIPGFLANQFTFQQTVQMRFRS
jgi:hypothetical protein